MSSLCFVMICCQTGKKQTIYGVLLISKFETTKVGIECYTSLKFLAYSQANSILSRVLGLFTTTTTKLHVYVCDIIFVVE